MDVSEVRVGVHCDYCIGEERLPLGRGGEERKGGWRGDKGDERGGRRGISVLESRTSRLAYICPSSPDVKETSHGKHSSSKFHLTSTLLFHCT